MATKSPVSRVLKIEQQFRASQFVSYLLGKKDKLGNPNYWSADFYVRLRTCVACRESWEAWRAEACPAAGCMCLNR